MSPHGHLLLCALRMLQDPTDLQFWTGEFLNVPCGDGLHFHSSFPMCSVLNMWIPWGVAIVEVKNVFLTYCPPPVSAKSLTGNQTIYLNI